MSAGKGDKPRSCFSKKFKDNFDNINWVTKDNKEIRNYLIRKGKRIYKYP